MAKNIMLIKSEGVFIYAMDDTIKTTEGQIMVPVTDDGHKYHFMHCHELIHQGYKFPKGSNILYHMRRIQVKNIKTY